MASILQPEGYRYWVCSYRSGDGRWLKKSTKQKDKRKALDFCLKLEEAERLALKGQLTTSQARKLFNEVVVRAGDEPIESFTVQEWLAEWLAGKKASHTASTSERYRKPLSDFVIFLGKRAALPLRAATPKDVRAFRDAQRDEGKAAATVNFAHKAIASAFEAARRQGYIDANPCHAVDFLPVHTESVEKGIFSPEEVSALLAATKSADWKGVIRLGFYTGLRLKDALSLTWGNVDLIECVIKLTPLKTARTGKKLIIPLHSEVESFLLKHPTGNRDSEPVFPTIHKLAIGGNRGASRIFKGIMKDAGLVAGILRAKQGEGGHDVSERSFHSLRHSFNTGLSEAGVAVEHRQKLTGHASEKQNLHYTHPAMKSLKKAVAKLPRLSKS